jgi:hypothetical protein
MSKTKRPKAKRKYFTPQQANAMLPLLRSIVRDVTALAHELRDHQDRLVAAKHNGGTMLTAAHREELVQVEVEFERGRDRMHEFLQELENLGIELKDPFTGLVDFRAMMDGREVYLCWRLDESEVGHWHELDAGFAGRQRLMSAAGAN